MAPKAGSSTAESKGKSTANPSAKAESSSTNAQPSTAGNKLSKDEKELFIKCLKADQRTLSHEELQNAMPKLDVVEKMSIANSLIARGMLQVKRVQDELFYIAVDKSQQKVNSSMSTDEKLVYDNISNAGNTGIWTKTLKMRTNIHQTNLTKCIKALENKNLIKAVKSVKFPTRKIYILSELQPSVEHSGGPWYTDNELDTEFIGVLLQSILKCLQDRSYPVQNSSDSDRPVALLYPASHTPFLPTTVHDVLAYLKQSQIIQEGTDLNTEHILTLLDVLLYDGVVERITVGTAKCEGQAGMSESDEEDEDDQEEQEEEEEEEQSELEDDGLLMAQKRRKSLGSTTKKSSKRRKTNSGKQLRFQDRSDEELMEEEEKRRKRRAEGRRMIPSNEAFVYRALRPLPNQVEREEEEEEETGVSGRGIVEPPSVSGFFDMPCGHCPSFDFCSSKGKAWQFKGSTTLGSTLNSTNQDNGPASFHRKLPKIGLAGIGAGFNAVGGLGAAGGVAPVNPADCVYFTEWLDF
ncbi:34-kDa subunit of RNA polymerase III (C) [Puccinia graminis f. sp. tritici]|uniref:34-kDa subunit of RNA polymerase III (C) n=1 Tax=Puccinia graminis f. sp. tritici TaxID=56615 RepID=A0A5B0RHK8_PUCGR|nr:34-kDa subunit of RNA polymerase III (C) [Puccinia graminis f. sp. tritici]